MARMGRIPERHRFLHRLRELELGQGLRFHSGKVELTHHDTIVSLLIDPDVQLRFLFIIALSLLNWVQGAPTRSAEPNVREQCDQVECKAVKPLDWKNCMMNCLDTKQREHMKCAQKKALEYARTQKRIREQKAKEAAEARLVRVSYITLTKTHDESPAQRRNTRRHTQFGTCLIGPKLNIRD
ncbi:hypothetical protein C8J56DRAFT_419656 [Mycena floridula]|nr:hypothetical protein C8J56DRAFT_419656 [Mycena floridula]